MTPEQEHILRHSLGVPDPGQYKMYRNHFVTGEGSIDHPDCLVLVGLGLMTRQKGNELSGGMDIFYVTKAGKEFVKELLLKEKTP